tara:strand:+ start:4037 stop:5980 length:1944 start_codon:yes stop_codon:yes gene_type:complete
MRISFLHAFLIGLLSVLILAIYFPGLSGALYYDDYTNLDGLARVVDFPSALSFSLDGGAGPLGRPLALISFAVQAASWPDSPRDFLLVNLVIHVVNAGLLYFISFRVLTYMGIVPAARIPTVAFLGVLLWSVLPINVSATLIAIQRMTGLSAVFGLMGILSYLYCYRLYTKSSMSSFSVLVLQFGSLCLFVSLSIFVKESGALIPFYVLVLELTLLRSFGLRLPYYRTRIRLLSIGLLGLLIYLSPLNQNWFAINEYRGFSVWERVTTQWVVLIQYLKLTFFPAASAFSPFHDDVSIYKNTAGIVFAGLGLFAACIGAWFIRRKTVWPLFAVAWFFVGHLLESTSVLLELYFEHRNYLAVFGGCLALSYYAAMLPKRYERVGISLFAFYIVIAGFTCYVTNSIWGDAPRAAELWASENPRSTRAALHLATIDIQKMGGSASDAHMKIISAARRDKLVDLLDRTIAECPECIAVSMQALLYSCNIRSEAEVRVRFDNLVVNAAFGKSSISLVDGIFPLTQLISEGRCSSLALGDIQNLIEILKLNDGFSSQMYASRLYYLSAEVAYRRGYLDLAWQELGYAESIGIMAVPVLVFQVHLALEMNDFESAMKSIIRRAPFVNDTTSLNTLMLDQLKEIVEQARVDYSKGI